jgi:hypothetical protein
LVDSPLFIPANAMTFSFILGLAYAQSWSNHNSGPSDRQRRSQHPADLERPAETGSQNE